MTEPWKQHAACRGHSPDLFFIELRGGDMHRAYPEARRLCANCPVADECRDYVDRTEDWQKPVGFWAGETASQRTVRRRNAAAPHGTDRRWRQGCSCPPCIGAHDTWRARQPPPRHLKAVS